ncbi:MAG: ATP-grasp domain-containing protein, partial [Proteobacteria bacterium]
MSKIKEMAKSKSNQAPNQAGKKPNRKNLGPRPLGILGGGQLARMMALQAHKLGIPVAIYCASKDEPAAQVAGDWQLGSLGDERALRKFLEHCSVVTFESEFMDAARLARLSTEIGTKVYPSPSLMGALQDRLTQKMLLERHKLPTAHFHNVKDEQAARIAFNHFGGQVVFKKRRFGYDGYGTFVVRNEKELTRFLPHVATEENGFICEEFVPFKREVAVIATRSQDGSSIRYPFVETFQENSRCLWVRGPLAANEKLAKLGREIDRFLRDIDYVGTIGIELFETKNGYIVNELAPRVHNSGHYTQDAMTLDQFSAHIQAVS